MDIRTRPLPCRLLLLLLAALCLLATPAPARQLAPTSEAETGAPEPPGEPDRSAQAESDQVLISVDQFGVGDMLRPGDYFGIRIVLRDKQAEPRSVAVTLHIPDPDGDTVRQERRITIGGDPRGEAVWLYGILPPGFARGDYLTVTVHPITDDAVGASIASRRPEAMRVLNTVTERRGSDFGLIGVIQGAESGLSVGRLVPGLSNYKNPTQYVPQSDLETQHQPFEIVDAIDISLLPDRWMGLAPYEALIWNGIDPAELDGARAGALREWILRGGHLVVLLRHPGQAWFGREVEEVGDFVPAATLRQVTDADIEDYRDLLTWRRAVNSDPLRSPATIYTFEIDEDAPVGAAVPIIAGADGPVVIRRLMGAGMITFVGLNLRDAGTQVRGDAFWHRILGQRFSVPEPIYKDDGKTIDSYPRQERLDETIADRGIGLEISRSRTAGVGILLALVLFVLYWVISGPGGYAFLKAYHWSRHSWIFFVCSTLLFTTIAWLGATLMRPSRVEGSHVTFYDHVYGQDIDHARAWMGVLLPRYGEQVVSVVDESDLHQSIQPWYDPTEAEWKAFPDARAYDVDSARPEWLAVPTRATMKQFQVDWAGPMTKGMLRPMPDNPPRINSQGRLQGAFTHDFGRELKDVQIIFIARQWSGAEWLRARGRNETGLLLAEGWAWSQKALPSDAVVDFEDPATGIEYGNSAKLTALLQRLTRAIRGGYFEASTASSPGDPIDVYTALSLYSLLEPPDFVRTGNSAIRKRVQRRVTHGLDLGKWATQPCLIVIGQLDNAPCPIPMRVDGRELPTSGRTVVRWIYPLKPDPPVFSGDAADGDDRDDQSL